MTFWELPILFQKNIKKDLTCGCWNWTGTIRNGYGRVWFAPEDRTVTAHRKIYELLVGSVAEGLELDHLCRNRSCVNPEHLEPVDRYTNQVRGNTIIAKFVSTTHCPKGHEYTAENTYLHNRRRSCRTCIGVSKAAYKERQKLKKINAELEKLLL